MTAAIAPADERANDNSSTPTGAIARQALTGAVAPADQGANNDSSTPTVAIARQA